MYVYLRDDGRLRYQGAPLPVHTWLPLAHVEAPTAGSVLLAGVLLKMGTYGFMRISCRSLRPSITIGVPLIELCRSSDSSTGLVRQAQDDIKKLVAYSASASRFLHPRMFASTARLTGA